MIYCFVFFGIFRFDANVIWTSHIFQHFFVCIHRYCFGFVVKNQGGIARARVRVANCSPKTLLNACIICAIERVANLWWFIVNTNRTAWLRYLLFPEQMHIYARIILSFNKFCKIGVLFICTLDQFDQWRELWPQPMLFSIYTHFTERSHRWWTDRERERANDST